MTVGGDFKIGPTAGIGITISSSGNVDSIGIVTATTFVGALTGNVTGTASANAVLTGSTNNQLVTVTGANAITGESGLTYDGSSLAVTGTITSTNSANLADGHVLCQLDSGNGRLKLLSGSDAITVDIQGSVGNVKIVDDGKFQAGDSNDLSIYHDGSHSNIINTTGVLKVRGAAGQSITFRNGDDSANVAVFNIDDATHLYHDSSHKFSTSSTGITVIGNCLPNSNDSGQLGTSSVRWQEINVSDVIDISDDGKIRIGDSDDMQLYHDGTTNFIECSSNFAIRVASGNRIEVNGTSGDVTMQGVGGKNFLWDTSAAYLNLNDSARLTLGTANDAMLYHDGSHTYVQAYNTGNIYLGCIHNGDVIVRQNSQNRFQFAAGGFNPLTDNVYDLGNSSLRWRNVYTTDLQLSNKGKTNDVDNTWGNYTIQEGESDLFLINNRSGKKYKFNLTEVS